VKYLLHLAYNGTNYQGWQRQKNTSNTVQELIEEKISLITQEKIGVLGCGRTDKGVHAQQFFAHFNYEKDFSLLVSKLNKVLPKDIVVYDCHSVSSNFNARFSAKSRTYRYFFHTIKNPLICHISSFYDLQGANFHLLEQTLSLIKQNIDFKAFCKAPDKLENTLCYITSAVFYANEQQNQFCIEFTSNRFLRGMIRIIAFRLFQVAKGSLSIEEFKRLLESGVNKEAVQFAYPQGLFLHRIEYPEIHIEPNFQLTNKLFSKMKPWT